MTRTINAIYENGVLKPRRKLPLREHTHVQLTIIPADNPIRRTRGMFRVSRRLAKVLIYDDTLLDA